MVCGGNNASFFVAEAELEAEPAAGGAAGAASLARSGVDEVLPRTPSVFERFGSISYALPGVEEGGPLP
jgi:hypothetical protein